MESGSIPGDLKSSPHLFNLHQLIDLEGLDAVRQRACTKAERVCVQAGAAMRLASFDADDLAFASAITTGLPHKRLDHRATPAQWHHESSQASLDLESVLRGHDAPIGLPYGAKARLILIYLQSEAMRHNTRHISMGSSMYAWLKAMSTQPIGGMTYRLMAEQFSRIACCHIKLTWKIDSTCMQGALLAAQDPVARSGNVERTSSMFGADQAERMLEKWKDGRPLFPERVVLGQAHFEALKRQPIPLRQSALRLLSNNSTAMDLYILLSLRLPNLAAPQTIPWSELIARFGRGYRQQRQVKSKYLDALRLALAVYPQARAEVMAEGLVLHPSAPPITPGAEMDCHLL